MPYGCRRMPTFMGTREPRRQVPMALRSMVFPKDGLIGSLPRSNVAIIDLPPCGESIFQRETGKLGPLAFRPSTLTAQALNARLGFAEISHPFHPLRGQRFAVLKTRRIAGVDTLILKYAGRGSFSISREWTDWGTPSCYDGTHIPPHFFDIGLLLDLVALIEHLNNPSLKI